MADKLLFSSAFRKVKQWHGVTGKTLYERTGISQNHISEYINGKRDIGTKKLSLLVEALDEESPGAKRDFLKLVGGDNSEHVVISPECLVKKMSQSEKARLLIALAESITPKEDKNHKQLAHQGNFL